MAVSEFGADVSNITKLVDKPNAAGMDSETLKGEFDKAGNQIKTYLNGTLVSQINAQIQVYNTAISNINSAITNIQNSMISFSQVYPVGSIYVSVNSTNPGTMFGGTWQRIEDRFLLASGSNYENGTTGGEATVTLTEDQIPSHTHRYDLSYGSVATSANSNGKIAAGAQNNAWQYYSSSHTSIKNTGGSQAHNNMPPYLAVYVWKRVS